MRRMMPEMESWQFLRQVGIWSVYFAAASAALGAALTRAWQVPASVLIGAGFDVPSLFWVVANGERVTAEDPARGVRLATAWVAVRLGVKVILLAAAAALPRGLSLWGMLAGLLVVDVVILGLGSAKAVMAMLR